MSRKIHLRNQEEKLKKGNLPTFDYIRGDTNIGMKNKSLQEAFLFFPVPLLETKTKGPLSMATKSRDTELMVSERTPGG